MFERLEFASFNQPNKILVLPKVFEPKNEISLKLWGMGINLIKSKMAPPCFTEYKLIVNKYKLIKKILCDQPGFQILSGPI